MNKHLLSTCSSLFVLGIVFFYQQIYFSDHKLHVIFCDVGQGDGIFIRTPDGQDIVVDGGPDESILSCLSSHMPFWDRKIELMILTHPHLDHYYGLIQIAKRYSVNTFVTQPLETKDNGDKQLLSLLKEKQTKIHTTCQGDIMHLSEKITVQTLWPANCERGIVENDIDFNTLSVSQLFSFGDFQLLLTGDVNAQIADEIDKSISNVDVLKVPHHGSGTGMDEAFLSAINPKIAVISVGAKNRYGHPSATTLTLLNNAQINTLRTDKNGTIEIVSDGRKFWVKK